MSEHVCGGIQIIGCEVCRKEVFDKCRKFREQQAEIERLRAMLADSISRETVIATELQRDEAREAARELWWDLHQNHGVTESDDRNDVNYYPPERYPWLVDYNI